MKELLPTLDYWKKYDELSDNGQLMCIRDRFGYPPVTIDDVYKEVLEQAENFKKYAN